MILFKEVIVVNKMLGGKGGMREGVGMERRGEGPSIPHWDVLSKTLNFDLQTAYIIIYISYT